MNYYERIQRAIDFMEENLENEIKIENIARESFMGESTFYRMFFAITGYQAKDYLIRRRMDCACRRLSSGQEKVIDVAVSYSYNSADAFGRIFKKVTGTTPGACAQRIHQYQFERLNIMEQYFETVEPEMLEQYPDVKVIKNLPDQRAACYCYYGRNPEEGAFAIMKEWVMKRGIDFQSDNYRIFGYNAPDSDPAGEEYGYEVCITIPEDMEIQDEKIHVKTLRGGRFAVISLKPGKDLGEEIIKGWQRFSRWLEGSQYCYGGAQWLEEHLGFDADFKHQGGVNLYMPVSGQV